MQVSDDAVLLRSYALEGDARAFAELVQRYAGLVYATARRITGSADAAEDVSQDCFFRLAQKSAAISGSVAAWLHRTSVNRSLEIIRAERSRRRREAAAATPGLANPDDATELISRVDEALAALPEELRVVLTEHFLCARSQVELAAALGVNQSTISRRIDQGVRELRAKLDRDGWTIAPLALPLLLQQSFTTTSAPATVCGALTKIGLSGVGGGAGAAVKASAAAGSLVLRLTIAACGCAAIVGGGLLLRTQFSKPVAPHQAAPATTRSVSKDADDDSDDNDDNGLDDKIDSLLQRKD